MKKSFLQKLDSAIDFSYTLKVIKKGASPYYYARGRAYGQTVEKSLRTKDRDQAEGILHQLFPREARQTPSIAVGWRTIDGLPGYEAHASGLIKGPKGALVIFIKKNGYEYVTVKKDGISKAFSVHRLVCTAFHGAPAPGMMALHKNDVKTDNRAANLYWGMHTQNALDLKLNRFTPNQKLRQNPLYSFPLDEFEFEITEGKIHIYQSDGGGAARGNRTHDLSLTKGVPSDA